jgi:HSP20 family protein
MALPVRVERGRAADPIDIARQDFGDALNRLFGRDFFGVVGDRGPLATLGGYGVDIREDADHVFIEADLPGFRKEDVDIALEDGTFTIIAERREEVAESPPIEAASDGPQGQQGQQPHRGRQAAQAQRPADRGNYLLRERRVERFVRSFTLPPNVDEQNVQARLEDGVLRITLNRREDAKARRVQVS